MFEAQAQGNRVPAQLSIVGVGDLEIAAHMKPPLTTVRSPKHAIGTMAADYLLAPSTGTTSPFPTSSRSNSWSGAPLRRRDRPDARTLPHDDDCAEHRSPHPRPGRASAGHAGRLRVVELADETAEYVGMALAGLGAEVVKVEPPQGSPTRAIGPFLDDEPGPERSLHFWGYNRGKRSVVLDLATAGARSASAAWSVRPTSCSTRAAARRRRRSASRRAPSPRNTPG